MHWMRRRPQGSEIQRLAANADYCHRSRSSKYNFGYMLWCNDYVEYVHFLGTKVFHNKIKILSASDQNTLIH